MRPRPALLVTGNDSPVSADSSVSRPTALRMRQSAATKSPACRTTRSPIDELVGRHGMLGAVAADAYEPARYRRAQTADRLLGTQPLRGADDRVDAEHTRDQRAVGHRTGDGRQHATGREQQRQRIGKLLDQQRGKASVRYGRWSGVRRASMSSAESRAVGPVPSNAVTSSVPSACHATSGPSSLGNGRRRTWLQSTRLCRARRAPPRSSQPSRVCPEPGTRTERERGRQCRSRGRDRHRATARGARQRGCVDDESGRMEVGAHERRHPKADAPSDAMHPDATVCRREPETRPGRHDGDDASFVLEPP